MITSKQTPDYYSSPLCVDRKDRIYAVGDIHGRFDLLKGMLLQINEDVSRLSDHRRNRIIFLGDYIDRGDQSREVIETLTELSERGRRSFSGSEMQFEFLIGNHEAAMLDFLESPERSKSWLQFGGFQTLASFGVDLAGFSPANEDIHRLHEDLSEKIRPFKKFFDKLQPLAVSGRVVFVHAGLDPDAPLERQPEEATLWGDPLSGKPLGMPGYRMVHGHFAASEPVCLPDRICVDTGAFHSGRLTAVRLDDCEVFLHAEI